MTFLQKFLPWLEFGSAHLITDFGRIYSKRFGKEVFTLDCKLLREDDWWVLRLDLRRYWGSTGNREVVDCYFKELWQIKKPFAQLLEDVGAGVTKANMDIGVFGHVVGFLFLSEEIIRSYGRIDNHPTNDSRFHTELFLSRTESQYWLVVSVGKGSSEWSRWPTDVGDVICKLLETIKI